jgi:hypothetical protein
LVKIQTLIKEGEMEYKVDKNKLLIDEKVVFTAPGEILDTLVNTFNNETILLIYNAYEYVPDKDKPDVYRRAESPEQQELINQNVVCLDKSGAIKWRIEPTGNLPEYHVRFTKNPPNETDIWTYRADAWEFKIDPQNGKILDKRLGL